MVTFVDAVPFALIVVSSVSHALWNYMAKGSSARLTYIWLMNVTSQLTVLPFFILFMRDWSIPWNVLPLLVASGCAELIYFLALSRAYDVGDLSLMYPLARSSPLFVAVLSMLILGERISPWGVAGILLIVVGVYTLHLKSFRVNEILLPLRSVRGAASQLALLAALGTTAYSIIDSRGVALIDPVRYNFWLEILLTLLLTPFALKGGAGVAADTWRNQGLRASVSGFLMRGGYMLVLIAMTMAPVSYILTLRQVSVVMGALLGVVLLKESYGRMRLLSSAIIFIGVYILGALA